MKRKISTLVCLLLALVLAGSCLATSVARPANGCVADMAGVLERGTVEHIVAQNQTLTNSTGAVIAVVTVDFLNGMDIDDYATDLFNDWGLGDAQAKNGLLILLAIGEDNYSILQGAGLQSALPTSTLGEYAGEYLEPDFAAGNYDAGVGKLFDALYAWFEDYYAGSGSNAAPGQGYVPEEGRGSELDIGAVVIFTLVIFFVVALLIAMTSWSRGGYGYYYSPYSPYHYRRRPFFWRRRRHYGPPAPPRPSGYRPHTGSSHSGGGSSRGGGFTRSGGSSHRSSGSFGGGSFRASGGRSGFGGGHSRGGGFSRR